MARFDNIVYMTICEVTLKLAKNSNCRTHASYCRLFSLSLKHNNLSAVEKAAFSSIVGVMDLVFSLSAESTSKYIFDYFNLEMYLKFEKPVRLTQEYFPQIGKIY